MKITKILAFIIACCAVVCMLVACGGGTDNSDATTTTAADDAADVKLTVSIKVLDVDGNAVYETENYSYSGKAPTLIELIEDYLYMEHESSADFDEYGTLASIGSIDAGVVTSHDADKNEDVELYTTFWWYRLNGREGSEMMEEYLVQDKDVVEIYLAKKK